MIRLLVGLIVLVATTANAQTREFMVRGFGDIGATSFTAEQSFEATLGSQTGAVFGGGVEVVFPSGAFADLRASTFRQTGERVFVFGGRQYSLGIPARITLTPLQITAGYRFGAVARRVRFLSRFVPYAGAGTGWYAFKEISGFAADEENVEERFAGFHILGGGEVGLRRWLALAGELQWATVPDALGEDLNSVSHEFHESDLGGTTFRVRVIVGM